jgi:hypothetical protein
MADDDSLAPNAAFRRGGFAIAKSAQTAQPGEVVAVDRKGRVLDARGTTRANVKVASAVAILSGGAAAVLGAGIAGAIAASAVSLFWIGYILTRRQPYIAAHAQMLAGDIDGAEAALRQLHPPRRGPIAAQACATAGWIAYARGNNAAAIERFERAIEHSRGNKILRLTTQIGLADVLARSGDRGRARALRETIALPREASPLFEVSLAGVDITLAILEGTEATLDQDALDRWIRIALELNNTTIAIAKLARVCAARGDDDLADHLAGEFRERFSWCPLSYWPELDAWMTDRVARSIPATDGA